MALPREEQETVIRIGFYGDTHICTTNPTHARKYIALELEPTISRIPVKWEEKDDGKGGTVRGKPIEFEDTSWQFTAPAEWFKHPRPKKRMSDETKAKHAARLAQARLGEGDTNDVDDEGEEE